MQAIILAGGKGERLTSITGGIYPKPMAPIAGEPFMAHLLRYLAKQGVTDVVLAVGHRRELIRDYFGKSWEDMTVLYAQEDAPLGTGGAIKHALSVLSPEAPVLVLNADSFVDIDISRLAAAHNAHDSALTVLLTHTEDCTPYGQAVIDVRGRIVSFSYPGNAEEGLVSTGWYMMNPDVFSSVDMPAAFSFEADFKQPYCELLLPQAYVHDGYFIDIGTPDTYHRACRELPGILASA